MEITCCKCGHVWDYKGKSVFGVSCSKCHRKNRVWIKENLKKTEKSNCLNCGTEYTKKYHNSKYCSPQCQRIAAGTAGAKVLHEKHDMSGKNNPNWKGGISKNNYRYKKIQMERYPKRVKARQILMKALESGKIKRPEICPKCKGKRKVHAHHKDYSKPLEVEWLCRPCHRQLHDGTH